MKKTSKPAVKAILVILVLIICGIGALSYFNVIDISSILSPTQKEKNNIFLETSTESESQNQNTIKTFDDNDYISIPAEEHIAYDENASMVYYDDQLVVYTFSDFSEEDAKKLADLVGGEIVGDISGDINALQIQVEPTDLNDLESMADKLMNVDGVMYAGYNYPIQISLAEATTDPWSEDADNPETDLGDEENPDGNDWWAEAIGAYTAWDYSDQCQPIKVGILDSGFDIDHKDLIGSLTFLPDYTVNSEDNHGTLVAGIIAANANGVGIRGIADTADIVCTDWSPTESVSYLSTIEYARIEKQMIESGVKVINNSWGYSLLSELTFNKRLGVEYEEQLSIVRMTGAYDRFLEYYETLTKRTALECVVMMTQQLLNGNTDFIIVQGAGNGYDNGGAGVDAHYGGFWCTIDEEVYDLLSDSTKMVLMQHGIDYTSIDERILIVGGVENIRNKDGYYKMMDMSNFGDNVDICAPGYDVYSTKVNDNYGADCGTSFSAPMVTGSTALIWSLKPELSAPEVRDILLKNVKTRAYGMGEGEGCEYPMLNVGATVKAVMGDNENSDSVDLTDYYTEFVKSEGYKADWKKNPYGDEYTVIRYAVVDLDQDGTPELVLSSDLSKEPHESYNVYESCNVIYTFDTDTHKIKKASDFFITNYSPEYSEEYRAIVDAQNAYASPVRTMVYYELVDSGLKEIGGVKADNGGSSISYVYTYASTLSGEEQNISEEEGVELFAEVKPLSWHALAELYVEENTSLDLTDGYWQNAIQAPYVYKFNADGTMRSYAVDPFEINEGKTDLTGHLGRDYFYTWDGKALKIFVSKDDKEPMVTLYYVTLNAKVEWELEPAMEKRVGDGEYFFYETGYVLSGALDSNAFYLQKSDIHSVIEE